MYSLKNRDTFDAITCQRFLKATYLQIDQRKMFQNVLSCSFLWAHTLTLTPFHLAPAHTPKIREHIIFKVSSTSKHWEFTETGSLRWKLLHTKEPSLQPPQLWEFRSGQWEQDPLTSKPKTSLGNLLFRNGFVIKLEIQVKKRKTKRKEWTSSLSTHNCPQPSAVTSWQKLVCLCGDDVYPTISRHGVSQCLMWPVAKQRQGH